MLVTRIVIVDVSTCISRNLRCVCVFVFFFFQAEDGIRDLVRSRGLGDVYKRQVTTLIAMAVYALFFWVLVRVIQVATSQTTARTITCLLYTSDAADERSSVDLGGRRIIKKKKKMTHMCDRGRETTQQE